MCDKMEVFILFEKDGYGGDQPARVFESKLDAEIEFEKGGYLALASYNVVPNGECRVISMVEGDDDLQ